MNISNVRKCFLGRNWNQVIRLLPWQPHKGKWWGGHVGGVLQTMPTEKIFDCEPLLKSAEMFYFEYVTTENKTPIEWRPHLEEKAKPTLANSLIGRTGRDWPMRWARDCACKSCCGFQSLGRERQRAMWPITSQPHSIHPFAQKGWERQPHTQTETSITTALFHRQERIEARHEKGKEKNPKN